VSNEALAHPGLKTIADLAQGEPEWLLAERSGAWTLFDGASLPDRALHRWRYTDPSRLLPGERSLSPALPLAADPSVAAPPASLVIARGADGRAAVALSPEAEKAGVIAIDLSRAASELGERLRERLGRLVEPGEHPFAALNSALWTGGLYLEVPAGVRLAGPILHVRRFSGPVLSVPRMLAVVGDGAEVVVVDEQLAADGTGGGEREAPLSHRVQEWVVGAGAKLTVVARQDLPPGAAGTTTARARLERDASMTLIATHFGGSLVKSDVAVELAGEGARSEILGLVFGTGRQHFDHHVVQHHLAPHTTSRLNVQVALKERAKSAFTGMLRIGADAVHSEAYQENRNLLLDETTNAISIPELEILTDEVQASHGATVGPIDEDQLFYLSARGLPRPEAERMIVSGFFEPSVARIPDEGVREQVRQRVERRLAR